VVLLARFCQEADLTVVPFGAEHWPVAVDAYTGHHAAVTAGVGPPVPRRLAGSPQGGGAVADRTAAGTPT
jgi:hypothetical protein